MSASELILLKNKVVSVHLEERTEPMVGELLTFNNESVIICDVNSATTEIIPIRSIVEITENAKEISVSRKVIFYKNLQDAIEYKSTLNNQNNDYEWSESCKSFYMAIKNGCINDIVIQSYLNAMKSHLSYFSKEDSDNFNTDQYIEEKVSEYQRLENLISDNTVAWNHLTVYGMMTTLGLLYVLKLIKKDIPLLLELKKYVGADSAIFYDVDKIDSWNFLKFKAYMAYVQYSTMVEEESIKQRTIDELTKIRKKIRDKMESNPDSHLNRFEREIDKIIDKIEDKDSTSWNSIRTTVFKIALYNAQYSTGITNDSNSAFYRNEALLNNALGKFRGLIKNLYYFSIDIDDINKRHDFINNSYWQLMWDISRTYLQKYQILEKFVTKKGRARKGHANFGDKESMLNNKRDEYAETIRKYATNRIFGDIEIKAGDCPFHKINGLAEPYKKLGLESELEELLPIFETGIITTLKEAFYNAKHELNDANYKGIQREFSILNALKSLNEASRYWNCDNKKWASNLFMGVIKYIETINGGEEMIQSVLKIIVKVPDLSIQLFSNGIDIKYNESLFKWFFDEINNVYNNQFLLNYNTGVARWCFYLASNTKDLNKKIHLGKLGIEYLDPKKDDDENGYYQRFITKLNKWETEKDRLAIFELKENCSLEELRANHMPIALAAFFKQFDKPDGLKHLTHGEIGDIPTFPLRLNKIEESFKRCLEDFGNNGLKLRENVINQISAYMWGTDVSQSRKIYWSDNDGNSHDESLYSKEWNEWITNNPKCNPFDRSNYEPFRKLPEKFKKSLKVDFDFTQYIERAFNDSDELKIIPYEIRIADNISERVTFYHYGLLPKIIRIFCMESFSKVEEKKWESEKIIFSLSQTETGVKYAPKVVELRITNTAAAGNALNWEALSSSLKGSIGNLAELCTGCCDFAIESLNESGSGTRYNILSSKKFEDFYSINHADDHEHFEKGFTCIFSFYIYSKDIFKILEKEECSLNVLTNLDKLEEMFHKNK